MRPVRRSAALFTLWLVFTTAATIRPAPAELLADEAQAHRAFLPAVFTQPSGIAQELYRSQNLQGQEVFAECNPGGGTVCECAASDAQLRPAGDYGEVISNFFGRQTYVNAIAYQKFGETFPDQSPVRLGVYRYTGEFSLPRLPAPQLAQKENPQGVHVMIQFWDGRDSLYAAEGSTLEGVIYWQLNPWMGDYGNIKIYTGALELVDAGLHLPVDTAWHAFELVVDLQAQRYRRIRIDDRQVDLSQFELARVAQPGWGQDVSLSITSESLAAWPQADCRYVFSWTTRFRNMVFSVLE